MSNISSNAVAGSDGINVGPEDLGAPEKLSGRFTVALILLYLGVYTSSVGLFIVSWPVTIARLQPDDKVLWLSVVASIYAVVNIIVTPIAGTLSDRCTARLGMRRPFILIGGAFAVAGLFTMGLSDGIGHLLIGVVLMGLGNSTITGAAGALVPDQVPERNRGRVQGLIMVCIALSGVVAAVFLPQLITNQLALFGVPAVIMVIAVIVVNIVLKDRRLSPAERASVEKPKNIFAEFKIKPSAVPDYSWAWISKVIVVLATVLTSTYGVYVLTDQLHVSQAELPGILTLTGLVGLFTAIGGAVGGSWLSDKLQKRKSLVLLTTIFMAAGAIIVAFSPNVPVYLIGLVLLGIGAGAYSPIDGALFIDVLPGGGKESGKYMSLMTVADQIPRSFGPLIGSAIVAIGAITAIGGYTIIYIVGAIVGIIGGIMVRKIKGSM
jgi:MFS family permease